jgi:serine/threonine protein kinase
VSAKQQANKITDDEEDDDDEDEDFVMSEVVRAKLSFHEDEEEESSCTLGEPPSLQPPPAQQEAATTPPQQQYTTLTALKCHALYKIQEKIRSGGFGDVYKGVRKIDHSPIAIKIIRKDKINSWTLNVRDSTRGGVKNFRFLVDNQHD